jgi:spore photoproduct lyase
MNIRFDQVYYEPESLEYPLGKSLRDKYADLPWIEIESHNKIPEFQRTENKEFSKLKQHLVVGVRKTHKYTENHKVSDWLVPYTSSGCRAMCLYCYLVCNYNKCSYLRLFVNREQMMERLLKVDAEAQEARTFEIGSNSDLILENTVTGNLKWTIDQFSKNGRGRLTFPTKFDMVEPLLDLDHQRKIIFRMSVNPEEIIRSIEIGTCSLDNRIQALNAVCDAGYPVGMLIAPVILLPDWKQQYFELIEKLNDTLNHGVKQSGFIEIIFMTYSFVQNAINADAFPGCTSLFDKDSMTGRGKGKYCYHAQLRAEAEEFLRGRLSLRLPNMPILYIV